MTTYWNVYRTTKDTDGAEFCYQVDVFRQGGEIIRQITGSEANRMYQEHLESQRGSLGPPEEDTLESLSKKIDELQEGLDRVYREVQLAIQLLHAGR